MESTALPSRRDHVLAVYTIMASAVLGSCDGDGQGVVRVTAYGEPFIEQGIPATALHDGWAVAFRRFDVSLRDVTVAGVPIAVPEVINLAAASGGQGHELASAPVPVGSCTGASFTLARLDIDGVATKGNASKSFRWVFPEIVHYKGCETKTTVTRNAPSTFQITVHADHLFYDSMVSSEPKVLFQPLADADTDGNGVLTDAELRAKGIGAYDLGSDGALHNLWDWLTAQVRTVGHVNGESHCRTARGP